MKKNLKRIAAAALAAVTVLAFAGCGGGSAAGSSAAAGSSKAGSSAAQGSSAAPAGGELKVGMEADYAPFNWTQMDNKNNAADIQGGGFAGGYDVMIAQKIAEGLGKKLVVVKTEWDGLSPALTSGKIDMIIAGMSPTAERKQTIDFSDTYYTSDLVVVVKKDSKFASAKELKDFSGAKITGQLNTFHYGVIDQIEGVAKQNALEDFATMITAVKSGKIDGYVSERPGALAAVAANPELSFVEFAEGKGFKYDENEVSIAVGLKKGSDLTSKVNEILKGISKEDRAKMMEDAIKNQPVTE